MKTFVALFFLFCLFHMPQARAQCAPGIPEAGNPECLPPDDANSPYYQGNRNQQPARQQQPRGVWADRWGAVAVDDSTGDIGVAVNRGSESEAVANAMHDCRLKGSRHCKLNLAYHNQCAALAWGTHSSTLSNAADQNHAQANALKSCARDASDCKIVYSACSLPVRIQ